jgi:hypothetical protein
VNWRDKLGVVLIGIVLPVVVIAAVVALVWALPLPKR